MSCSIRVLYDDDSIAFLKIASLDLYDKAVKKEDCTNHAANHMYSGMDALKEAKRFGG